ncbi:ANTAR domain-containing protein [Streptomyces albus]|uniref:ANTAR domain-containing protein n=2 Tax=Streptomyces TaxID=1883 RepID=A0A8H1QT31_9ACTN|nr:ANTAR domain-containing protein [Streptomyces albus]
METRPVIDQARGVLMASWRCTPHTAWQVLVDASQRTNTKLREIAVLLTGSTQGEPLPDWLRSAVLSSYARIAGTPAPGRGPRPR